MTPLRTCCMSRKKSVSERAPDSGGFDIAEGGFISSIDVVTGLLKLNRQKERRRHIDSLHFGH